jgi:hypothetical protein
MCPPQTPNMSSSSSSSSSRSWLLCYIELRFFVRIRRFLRSKAAARKRRGPSDGFDMESVKVVDKEVVLQVMESESEDESAVLQRSVKKLHFGTWEEKEKAAQEIQRLAREDGKVRKLMAELGVIPVLVAMVASEVACRQRVAVTALIELSNGSYT